MNAQRVTESGLTHFLAEAKQFPMLALEREQELARAWRDRHDGAALRQLVGSHLRLVVKIARGYTGYGLPMDELIAEGNVGLMQAAEKFDADRGFRFATYAMWWIRAAIQEYILRSWSLVKMGTTAAQKKLFFNLRKLKAQMQELESGDLAPETVRAIATALAVPEQDVVEMNRRLAGADSSLNVTLGAEADTEWLDLLGDDRPSQETLLADADELALRKRLLASAMEGLTERERKIVVERRLKDDPLTLEALSHQFNVSRERVRQIEARALEKLRKSVLNAARSLRHSSVDLLPAAA